MKPAKRFLLITVKWKNLAKGKFMLSTFDQFKLGEKDMPKKQNITPLGERIKRKRLNAGLTQGEVAGKMKIAQATVSQWETGRSIPTDDDLSKIGAIIGKVYRPQVSPDTNQLSDESEEEIQTNESPFSVWLHKTRVEKDLSVTELALKANITPTTIYAIETGKIGNPQKRTQKKIINALGVNPPRDVTDETGKDAQIEGMGQLVDFNPYEEGDLPTCPGVYVLYDISDRPIYVGQGGDIKKRIKDHEQKFWFKRPIVENAAYVEITESDQRRQIETLLIKFLKSNAVINVSNTDR